MKALHDSGDLLYLYFRGEVFNWGYKKKSYVTDIIATIY